MRKLNLTKTAKIETSKQAAKRLNASVSPVVVPATAKPTTAPDSVQKAAAKKAAPVATTAKAAKAAKPAKAPRVATVIPVHEIAPTYAGASTGFNASRSRSTLRLDIGSNAFTYRDDSTLRDLIGRYKAASFARLNTDAGIIRRLHAADVLTVSDNGQTLTVNARGIAYAGGSKPLNPGDKIPISTVAEIAARKPAKPAKHA